jgi:hypothetical protein
MDADRWRAVAPLVAAVAAAATVLLVLIPAASGGGTGPLPPAPVPPAPQPLDRLSQSLDRCAAALDSKGFAGRYPQRADWRPLAQLFSGGMTVTLLDGDVPFVCATGPSVVEVSDPQAAVPVDTALLVLSTSDGVLAAVAPDGARVEVTTHGEGPSGLAANRHFIRVAAGPITDAGQLAVTVGDASGVRRLGSPERLAPPVLSVVDRRSVPADRSAAAVDLMWRCLGQVGADSASQNWEPVQVLAYRRGDQPASVLVAAGRSSVGGCSIAPGEVTPLRPWGPNVTDAGARPFVWLTPLPDLTADVAAGPVRPEVVRMEVTDVDGRAWRVNVAAGTFVGQAPPGSQPDPRTVTVRAFDADGTLLYTGPAVD